MLGGEDGGRGGEREKDAALSVANGAFSGEHERWDGGQAWVLEAKSTISC